MIAKQKPSGSQRYMQVLTQAFVVCLVLAMILGAWYGGIAGLIIGPGIVIMTFGVAAILGYVVRRY